MLHRLCFKFTVSGNFHDERNVYEEHVFAALFIGNLPDTFKKSLALYIAHCAAYFADDHIGSRLAGRCLFFCKSVYSSFDFFCNVGNYLYGSAQIITAALT